MFYHICYAYTYMLCINIYVMYKTYMLYISMLYINIYVTCKHICFKQYIVSPYY